LATVAVSAQGTHTYAHAIMRAHMQAHAHIQASAHTHIPFPNA